MEDKEEMIKSLGKIEEQLIEAVKMEFARGVENVDVDEAGKVIDMIYDIAKAKKNCYEAEYYKTVIEAMEEQEEEQEKYGFTRFPPKRMMPWFKPYVDQEPYIEEYLDDREMGENMRMGYNGGGSGRGGGGGSGGRGGGSGGRGGGSSGGGSSGGSSGGGSRSGYWEEARAEPERQYERPEDSRYGRAYNDYRKAKKFYTQTNSPQEKENMKTHAHEHLADTLNSAREIWKDADPELKKRMKTDFTALIGEMNI